MKKKKPVAKKQIWAALIIGVCALLATYVLVALSVTPVRYDIAVGEVSPVTVTASRDVTDTVSTQTAQDLARAAVPQVYAIDEDVASLTQQAIEAYFEEVNNASVSLRDVYIMSRVVTSEYTTTYRELLDAYDPSRVDWNEFLTQGHYDDVRSQFGDMSITDEAIRAMAAMDTDRQTSMAADVNSLALSALEGRIREENLGAEKDDILRQITLLYPDTADAAVAYYPVGKWLRANWLPDMKATEQEREEAADKVQPVIYKQNQTVVLAGEVVSQAQHEVLLALGVVGNDDTNYLTYIGLFLLLALLFGVYAVYLKQFEPEVFAETRKLLLLACIAIVVTALSLPLARLDARIIAAFLGTLLACVLISQRTALAFNVLLASITGVVASWETGVLSTTMLMMLITAVIGGSVSVYTLHKPGHRSSLLTAGLAGGAASMLTVILIWFVSSAEIVWDRLFVDCALAIGSGLLGGVLAIGTLPIWEAIFRVSTPAKLLELSNPNHPLLKRLTVEAPGTYHHSILTANLAEAGADALAANALLCRVGAYFHDVGKLARPRFFMENQKGENPHDTLDPRESAKIIIGHLEHGLELAHKYKLPREVQKIMVQHHGDSLVPYFFHKAKEAGLSPKDRDFRYMGSRPSTKESAIVMLADCVEAAVRSMGDADREQVKDMIDRLIRDKYNDGQLDDCPLSRRDMNTLAQAFLQVFDGALHERVKYPGQE